MSDQWLEFNLHDRVTMKVDASAPAALQLGDMFGAFLTSNGGVAACDLSVAGAATALTGAAHGDSEFLYTDHGVQITATDVQILREEQGYRVSGPGELLTTVLPLVDHLMIRRGAAMIHAGTVEWSGHGICMPAWGGVGKTSTVAKLMRLDGVRFMGDDWAFLSDDGELLGYAKPMFIKPHHRPIYPHLFSSRRKPLVPSRLSRPFGSLTTKVHPFMTRHPRLARRSRRWSPEYIMATPAEAFPEGEISTRAPLDLVVFVDRFEGTEPLLEPRPVEWMVSRMIGNFHAEMSVHSREVLTALAATGILPIEQFFADKRMVLTAALEGKPSFLLHVPAWFPPDHASDVIVDHLDKALAEAGVV